GSAARPSSSTSRSAGAGGRTGPRQGPSLEGHRPMTDLDDAMESGAYATKVGGRLRSIRRQKHLSLQDVEAASEQEFKASVLGAYERGERAISVPRLQRLARFYRVPVDQLLPGDDGPDFGPRPGDADLVIDLDRPAPRGDEKV